MRALPSAVARAATEEIARPARTRRVPHTRTHTNRNITLATTTFLTPATATPRPERAPLDVHKNLSLATTHANALGGEQGTPHHPARPRWGCGSAACSTSSGTRRRASSSSAWTTPERRPSSVRRQFFASRAADADGGSAHATAECSLKLLPFFFPPAPPTTNTTPTPTHRPSAGRRGRLDHSE